MNFENVYFILDSSQNGENVGGAARAMANFGFGRLRLVRPKNLDRAERVARYGHFVVKQAELFESLDEALADLGFVVATSGRAKLEEHEPVPPRQAAQELANLSSKHKVGILFGCEASGLSLRQLLRCDRISRVPTSPACPSMNLAQTVALYAWEICQVPRPASAEASPLASQVQKALIDQKVKKLLSGVKMEPAGRRDVLRRGLTRFFKRKPPNHQDARFIMRLLNMLNKSIHGSP